MTTDTVIMFENQLEQDLFEDAARRLGISITELAQHAQTICSDPVQVKGPPFTFPETCLGDDDVPAPSANVCLSEAWMQMRGDDRLCENILSHKPTNADVLKVIRNQLAWMRFCAARCKRAEDREVYRTMAAFREATIRALAARGRGKRGGQAMADALEQIVEPMQ